VIGIEPCIQANLGTFKHRADRDRVLLAASVAEQKPSASTFDPGRLFQAAAVRADGAIRPAEAFQVRSGGIFVRETLGNVLRHLGYLLKPNIYSPPLHVSSI